MQETIVKFIKFIDERLKFLIMNEALELTITLKKEIINAPEIENILNKMKNHLVEGNLDVSKELKNTLRKYPSLNEIIESYNQAQYILESTKKILQPNVHEETILYDTFDLLSETLMLTQFSSKEKMNLLFYIMKKECENPITKALLNNEGIEEQDSIDLKELDRAKFCANCLYSIKESYFDKKDTFEIGDIETVNITLKALEIDDSLCNIIQILLTKELEKRKKAEKDKKAKPVQKKQVVKDSNLLTTKEFKSIKKELGAYFDFYNVKVIRPLTQEEIMRCIELLIKIDSPIEEIKRFIDFTKIESKEYAKQNLNLLENNNPIALFIELYNKLKFYENKLNIQVNLHYIEQYLQEMFLCNDEDYEFYKNEIKEELRNILILLPQTYEYEIKENQKRIKFKK